MLTNTNPNTNPNYDRLQDKKLAKLEAKKQKKKQRVADEIRWEKLGCLLCIFLFGLAIIIVLVTKTSMKSPSADTIKNQYEHVTNTSAHFVIPGIPSNPVIPMRNHTSSSLSLSSSSGRVMLSSTGVSSSSLHRSSLSSSATVASSWSSSQSSTGVVQNITSNTTNFNTSTGSAGNETTISSSTGQDSNMNMTSFNTSTGSAGNETETLSSTGSMNNETISFDNDTLNSDINSSSSTGSMMLTQELCENNEAMPLTINFTNVTESPAFDIFVIYGYVDPMYHVPYVGCPMNQSAVFYMDSNNCASTQSLNNTLFGQTQRRLHTLPAFANDWLLYQNTSNNILFVNTITEDVDDTLSKVFDPTADHFQKTIATIAELVSLNSSTTIQGFLYDSDATLQIRNDNSTILALVRNLIAAARYELPTASVSSNFVYTALTQFDTLPAFTSIDRSDFSTAYITTNDSRYDGGYFYEALTQLAPLDAYNKTVSNTFYYAGFNQSGNYYVGDATPSVMWNVYGEDGTFISQQSIDDVIVPTDPIYGMFSAVPYYANTSLYEYMTITGNGPYYGSGYGGASGGYNTFYDSFALTMNVAVIDATTYNVTEDQGALFSGSIGMRLHYNVTGLFFGYNSDQTSDDPSDSYVEILYPWLDDTYQVGVSQYGWTQFAAVYDYNTDMLTVYRNGVSLGSHLFNHAINFSDAGNNGISFGACANAQSTPKLQNKYITNIRIHDQYLNEHQIKEIYYADGYKRKYLSNQF